MAVCRLRAETSAWLQKKAIALMRSAKGWCADAIAHTIYLLMSHEKTIFSQVNSIWLRQLTRTAPSLVHHPPISEYALQNCRTLSPPSWCRRSSASAQANDTNGSVWNHVRRAAGRNGRGRDSGTAPPLKPHPSPPFSKGREQYVLVPP